MSFKMLRTPRPTMIDEQFQISSPPTLPADYLINELIADHYFVQQWAV